jgi:hypothetical protein
MAFHEIGVSHSAEVFRKNVRAVYFARCTSCIVESLSIRLSFNECVARCFIQLTEKCRVLLLKSYVATKGA